MHSIPKETYKEITDKISSGDKYFLLGKEDAAFEEYSSALKLVNSALENALGNGKLLSLKLRCLIKCGWCLCQNPERYAEAFVYSALATSFAPKSADAHCLHGIICHLRGENTRAIKEMLCASELDCDEVIYVYNLSLLYAESDSKKAQEYLAMAEDRCFGVEKCAGGKFLMSQDWECWSDFPTNAKEIFHLGNKYYRGDGVKMNYLKAFFCYKRSAKLGYRRAQRVLGYAYEKGLFVSPNYSTAVMWYKKAANQGDAVALYRLGRCYEEGLGVEKSEEEAVRCYKNAARRGNVYAQHCLGMRYLKGVGVQKDKEAAADLFLKAAKQDYSAAQNNIGACFERGIGVKKDTGLAAFWYSEAAKQGDDMGIWNLGRCFEEGIGVNIDEPRAVELYSEAVERGNAMAMWCLARCYENGIGVLADVKRAENLYTQSAAAGCSLAQMRLKVTGEPEFEVGFLER